MDIVLGVSMTPPAVRIALVEGERADGVTLDQRSFERAPGAESATTDVVDDVMAAILGTRESAAEGGHRLVSTGVAWTDHAAAARLRDALRAQDIEDVILVSELHAAGALAQALGQAVGCERTALLFLERETATLTVVNTADGAVVWVASRRLFTADGLTELQDMIAGLQSMAEPPESLFLVGSGVDIVALKPEIAARTRLQVHAPEDGDLALARGAALASVNTPRYEASTVSLGSWVDLVEDTAAGPTQMAAAGYMAPLGYSAVPDDDDGDLGQSEEDDPAEKVEEGGKPFLLVGSALSALFVVGVAALAISLAVVIRPTVGQRPGPVETPLESSIQAPASPQVKDIPAPPPETIQAPIPVVQEAPRTVFVTPRGAAPVAPPAAPAPPPAAAAPPPAAAPPAPAAPPPAPAPAAPAPVPAPAPIIVPVPIVPPLFQAPIFQVPTRSAPRPRYPTPPSTVPTYPSQTPSATQSPAPVPSTAPPSTIPPSTGSPSTSEPAPTTSYPTYTPPVTTQAPSSESGSDSSGETGSYGSGGSDSSSGGVQTSVVPLWPTDG